MHEIEEAEERESSTCDDPVLIMEKLACRVLDGWRHGRHYLHHHCHSTDMAFSFKNFLVGATLSEFKIYAPILHT